MNKYIRNFYLYMILGIILFSSCVLALPNSLNNYFRMNDTSGTVINDLVTGNSLVISAGGGSVLNVSGVIDEAKFGSDFIFMSNNLALYNTNLFKTYDKDFTINYWVNYTINDFPKFYLQYGGGANNYYFYGDNNTFNLYCGNVLYSKTDINSEVIKTYTPNSYHMITYVYYLATGLSVVYIDGESYTQFDSCVFPLTNDGYNLIRFNNNSIDELSFWNSSLSSYDVETLYNNSYGMGYNNIGQPSETTLSFIDICFFNGRLGFNDLCHNLYINSSVGLFCSITDIETCPLGCVDNSSYYENLGISPIDNNYSARCSINYHGLASCDNLNDVRCNGTEIIETCLPNTYGFNNWIQTATCINSGHCVNGVCYQAGENPPATYRGLFSGWTLEARYYLMLALSVVALIIFFVLGATFGDATSGFLVGLVMSIIVSLVLSITLGLSLLIPILYILIGGVIITILIRKVFVGG